MHGHCAPSGVEGHALQALRRRAIPWRYLLACPARRGARARLTAESLARQHAGMSEEERTRLSPRESITLVRQLEARVRGRGQVGGGTGPQCRIGSGASVNSTVAWQATSRTTRRLQVSRNGQRRAAGGVRDIDGVWRCCSNVARPSTWLARHARGSRITAGRPPAVRSCRPIARLRASRRNLTVTRLGCKRVLLQ